jgi:hypothetical protein
MAAVHNWGNEDLIGRQNIIRANISAFHPLISYKDEFMLWLILGVFTWLGSLFGRSVRVFLASADLVETSWHLRSCT